MNISNCSGNKESPKKANDKKKKKKRGGSKKKMTVEQTLAFKSVSEWVFLGQPSLLASTCAVDDFDFGLRKSLGRGQEKLVFELHTHSKFSDGFLSPSKLVERAYGNGVSFYFHFSDEWLIYFCLFWCFFFSG